MKFTMLTVLSVRLSGIQFILCATITAIRSQNTFFLSRLKQNSMPMKQYLPLPSPHSPW